MKFDDAVQTFIRGGMDALMHGRGERSFRAYSFAQATRATGYSRSELKRLVQQGRLSVVETSSGRSRITERSLEEYLDGLRKPNGATDRQVQENRARYASVPESVKREWVRRATSRRNCVEFNHREGDENNSAEK